MKRGLNHFKAVCQLMGDVLSCKAQTVNSTTMDGVNGQSQPFHSISLRLQ